MTDLWKKFDRYIKLNYDSKSTISTYTNCYWRFVKDNDRVYRMSRTDVENYMTTFKDRYSVSYYNQMLSMLHILYNGVLKQPRKLEGLSMRKQPDTLQNVLSVDQVRQCVSSLSNYKHKTILCVLYLSGLRVSELLGLELSHIDYNNSRLKVVGGKGNKDRYVPVTTDLLNMIIKYRAVYSPQKYLIEGKPDSKYSASSVRSICKSAGINNPHLLRHSIITHLIDQGNNSLQVGAFAGHKSTKSTQKYYHLGLNSLNSLSLPQNTAYASN